MSLQLYYDNNSNCVKDINDIPLAQASMVEIDSNNVAIDTISSTSGLYYTAYGNSGDVYSFKVISAPAGFHVTCPVNGVIDDTLGALSIPTAFIGMQCGTSTSFDLSAYAVIPVTGVNDQWGNIYVQNNYCQPVNATLTLHYSPKYAGIPNQITPAAVSVTGNSITWNLNALSSTNPGPLSLHYSVWKGAAQVPIGDTVNTYIEITPTAGDTDISNNTVIIYDTVKGACDPNEMWVSPEHCIPDATQPVQLKYTFMFENTGNDTAHNIYVMDTLSDNVDVSSMRLLMSSHQMYISKLKDPSGHNILKFDFPNIMLPDSSHHGECDGTVIFYINTRPGLTAGTHIYNRAGIYFDYNDAVMTNQVDNLIGCFAAGVTNPHASAGGPEMYPNPATTSLTISTDNAGFASYTILNSLGKTVADGKLVQQQTQVNVKSLPPGLYFVHITGINGSMVKKFLKI